MQHPLVLEWIDNADGTHTAGDYYLERMVNELYGISWIAWSLKEKNVIGEATHLEQMKSICWNHAQLVVNAKPMRPLSFVMVDEATQLMVAYRAFLAFTYKTLTDGKFLARMSITSELSVLKSVTLGTAEACEAWANEQLTAMTNDLLGHG